MIFEEHIIIEGEGGRGGRGMVEIRVELLDPTGGGRRMLRIARNERRKVIRGND